MACTTPPSLTPAPTDRPTDRLTPAAIADPRVGLPADSDWPTAVRRVPGANASPATGTAARPSAEVQRVRTAADVLARPQTVTLPGRYGPGELRRLDPAALSFAASAVVGGGSRGLEAMPPPPPAAAVEVVRAARH